MVAHLFDQRADMMIDGAARSAHEVEMLVGMGELPSGGVSGSEVGLANDLEIGEQRQGPVHRGEIHRRIPLVHPGGDLLGRQMVARRPKRLPHEHTRPGDPVTAFAQDGG